MFIVKLWLLLWCCLLRVLINFIRHLPYVHFTILIHRVYLCAGKATMPTFRIALLPVHCFTVPKKSMFLRANLRIEVAFVISLVHFSWGETVVCVWVGGS